MSDIVSDIRNHLLTMAPHQRERLTAWQLRVAADEIERLRRPATWQEEQAAVEAAFERSGVERKWPSDEPDQIIPMVSAMAAEIARLRLTDEEREAIRLGELAYPGLRITDQGKWVDVWAVLRGLVDRHGGA